MRKLHRGISCRGTGLEEAGRAANMAAADPFLRVVEGARASMELVSPYAGYDAPGATIATNRGALNRVGHALAFISLTSLGGGSSPGLHSAKAVALAASPLLDLLNGAATGCQQHAMQRLDTLLASGGGVVSAESCMAAIPTVIRLLSTTSIPSVQEMSARVLQRLSAADGRSRNAVVAAGAIPLLVKLLSSGAVGVQCAAAGALRDLAANATVLQHVVAAGAARQLSALLLRSPDTDVQQAANQALLMIEPSLADSTLAATANRRRSTSGGGGTGAVSSSPTL